MEAVVVGAGLCLIWGFCAHYLGGRRKVQRRLEVDSEKIAVDLYRGGPSWRRIHCKDQWTPSQENISHIGRGPVCCFTGFHQNFTGGAH